LWLPDQEEQFREVTPLYAHGAERAPERVPAPLRRAATG
jgi:hypothetical protein